MASDSVHPAIGLDEHNRQEGHHFGERVQAGVQDLCLPGMKIRYPFVTTIVDFWRLYLMKSAISSTVKIFFGQPNSSARLCPRRVIWEVRIFGFKTFRFGQRPHAVSHRAPPYPCHDQHPVSIISDRFHVVRDDDNGLFIFVTQLAQRFHHAEFAISIQTSGRLVDQKDIRMQGQNTGNCQVGF